MSAAPNDDGEALGIRRISISKYMLEYALGAFKTHSPLSLRKYMDLRLSPAPWSVSGSPTWPAMQYGRQESFEARARMVVLAMARWLINRKVPREPLGVRSNVSRPVTRRPPQARLGLPGLTSPIYHS